jgi:hypothetical protein
MVLLSKGSYYTSNQLRGFTYHTLYTECIVSTVSIATKWVGLDSGAHLLDRHDVYVESGFVVAAGGLKEMTPPHKAVSSSAARSSPMAASA